jgi:hypothetical protein
MITVFGEGRGFRVVWLLEGTARNHDGRVDRDHGIFDGPPWATERACLARTTGREGYGRAMAACHATRQWAAQVAATRAAEHRAANPGTPAADHFNPREPS